VSRINWDEYKQYKKQRTDSTKLDNFEVLLEFLRSYYNMTCAFDVFEILDLDELGKMMLEKRNIKEAEDLEDYLHKRHS